MENYEDMLKDAYKNVKQVEGAGERFETPKIEGRYQGKKTILTNFFSIAQQLRRDPKHLEKFLLKELAASGTINGERLILNMKVSRSKIDKKIEEYTREFVLCKECGKPDTEIKKEDRLTFLKCLACGAKHTIRAKI